MVIHFQQIDIHKNNSLKGLGDKDTYSEKLIHQDKNNY